MGKTFRESRGARRSLHFFDFHAILAAEAPHNPGSQTVLFPGSPGMRSIHSHKWHGGATAATSAWDTIRAPLQDESVRFDLDAQTARGPFGRAKDRIVSLKKRSSQSYARHTTSILVLVEAGADRCLAGE